MTSTTAQSRDRFRLSLLIYDTRYRSYTIQAFALAVFLAVLGWLVNNTLHNLASAGKNLDLGFLGHTAGYKINQTLIAYGPESTYLRAAVLGLLNTLLGAFLGCVSTTILGTVIGVLRLSRNWLIAKLTAAYVEIFRNVPLLLWLLLIMAAPAEILPPPSAFRGDDATAAMIIFDTTAITNRGIYVPLPQFTAGFGGFALSITIGVVAIGFSLPRGILLALGRRSGLLFVRALCIGLMEFIRGVALITLLFVASTLLNIFLPPGTEFDVIMRVIIMATLFASAYMAKVIRGGLAALPKGQTEAANALGLKSWQAQRLIIMPQALKVSIPSGSRCRSASTPNGRASCGSFTASWRWCSGSSRSRCRAVRCMSSASSTTTTDDRARHPATNCTRPPDAR